jgi:hypothetical protein
MHPKILAFVLPQFHAIPENDAWWGQGFTEWVNTKRAQPLFKGHYQPRIPANGNYYDLTDPATQDWQAQLASSHGIDGFCYYHYWFNGKRLLEQPVNLLLERREPDFPFCLAWANEPWTRSWDGGDKQILMPQEYGDKADWELHFSELLRAFQDPRYIRVDGKPVFLIYRSSSIECCPEMFACWRQLALDAGLPGLHLVQMRTAFPVDTRTGLFDATMDFEPMHTIYHWMSDLDRKREKLARHRRKLIKWFTGNAGHAPNSFNYSGLWQNIASRPIAAQHYPGAFVDWDNSPRRELKRAIIFRNFSRKAFHDGFERQYAKACQAGSEFLFINAWNEWAEGTYLEPDEGRGLFFLETIKKIIQE